MSAAKDRKSRKIVLLALAIVLAVPLIALAQLTAFEEWAVTYDSSDHDPANPRTRGDSAAVLKLDPDGNVFVGGSVYETWGTGGEYSGVVLKYDPDGVGGPIGGSGVYANTPVDRIAAMVFDDSGNLYVTGTSDSETNSNWVTCKLEPAGDTGTEKV